MKTLYATILVFFTLWGNAPGQSKETRFEDQKTPRVRFTGNPVGIHSEGTKLVLMPRLTWLWDKHGV